MTNWSKVIPYCSGLRDSSEGDATGIAPRQKLTDSWQRDLALGQRAVPSNEGVDLGHQVG
jgi:hypothetical protein